MRRMKRHHDEGFKRQMVQEALASEEPLYVLETRYGLTHGTLSRWCRKFEGEPAGEAEEAQVLRTRIAQLERMVGRLTLENDFLKKFAAYTKQQTSGRSSIVTPKNWVPPKPAGLLGLPEAPTTTKSEPAKIPKKPGSKNV